MSKSEHEIKNKFDSQTEKLLKEENHKTDFKEKMILEKLKARIKDNQIHKKTVPEKRKKYKCDSCGNSFTKSVSLKFHIKTIHEGEINYKCDYCGKYFTQKQNLKTHIKVKHIHEGKRNHKCDSCGKLFTKSVSLKFHIKTIHEGERNYKCDYCGKSFTQSGTLKTHIKTLHEGQKNHKCDSCGKSFTQSGNLNKHIKTLHEGQTDHKRGKSGESTTMISNLKMEHRIDDEVDNNSLKERNTVDNSNFIDVSSASKFRSDVWKYFKRNEQGVAKCNECDKILEPRMGSSTYALRDHLINKHGIELEIKIKRSVWKHYKTKNKGQQIFGECNHCKKQYKYTSGNISSFESHLKSEHGISFMT